MTSYDIGSVINAGSSTTTEKTVRFPLQVEIAVIFTLLIALLGITLVWYSYSENRKVTLLAADDLFERITRHTATNIQKLYAPAEALVDLTAQLDVAGADNYSERQRMLSYFAESLRLAEHLSSIYLGYGNGELYMVQAIRGDNRLREAFGAPENSSFVVNSVEMAPDGRALQTFYYYDANLSLVGAGEAKETDFDPRQRRWYRMAIDSSSQITSGFYTFYRTGEIGTTIARRTPDRHAVVAADLTLHQLSTGLAAQRVTPASKVLVFNTEGKVLADAQLMKQPGQNDDIDTELRQLDIGELADPVFDALYDQFRSGMREGQLNLTVDRRDWMGSLSTLPLRSGREVFLAILVPKDELLAGIIKVRDRSLGISLVLLLFSVLAAWWIARRISRSLRTLSSEAEQVRALKLDTPITVRSHIMEVDELATTMSMMKSGIQKFIEISKALSAEKDFGRLLEHILSEAKAVCNADGGSVFLYDEEQNTVECTVLENDRTGRHFGGTSNQKVPSPTLSLSSAGKAPIEKHSVESGNTFVVDDISADARFDYTHVRRRFEQQGYTCQSLLHLPLRNRQGDIIGMLELVNARDRISDQLIGFKSELVSYVEAFSSQAAITLDNRRLLKAQKDLLDSFIQLIAGAIDAKSPYTSGHCQRVPELARMLAEAAHVSDSGPFQTFRMNDDEWYELYIASWLHDCGKVTTPEYVVDKATKLECIYNRIHEIRLRFEILWRDAQIAFYRTIAEGGKDRDTLQTELDARFRQLQDDYAFVAECNLGGEFMAEERIDRLKNIGKQTWLRHFDDRLGLSEDELARKQRSATAELPVTEYLIADKEEHIVPRDDGGKPFGENPHGFRMDVPQHAFNYGELYNLSVARGTLTDEDRFKINEHIIQTIILLNNLPFPRELRRVPAWAGNHHEKLDGTGYPRRLNADNLSIPERIMAIADIFEALTASDRPYKKAKTLSESIRIMSFMRNDGHLCPQLFDLFLSSGVYLHYAKQFLAAEQIDEVDVAEFLMTPEAAGPASTAD